VIQQKTQQPVQFEITEQTRDALLAWINRGLAQPKHRQRPPRAVAAGRLQAFRDAFFFRPRGLPALGAATGRRPVRYPRELALAR
jgi:hypothetical protein